MKSPTITLNDGRSIPQIGLGSGYVGLDTASLVCEAIEVGYRHIDTAKAYRTEPEVGEGIRRSGIPRSEIFVTSKLACEEHGHDSALTGLDGSLQRLGLDYLDLYLIHFPNPDRDLYVDSWRALIKLREQGLVKSIGVSNFEPEHVDRLVKETGVTPAVNQVELHPRFQQRPVRKAMAERGIQTESWSPLLSGVLVEDPVFGELVSKYGRSPAQIVLRWHLQHGLMIIPKSERRAWMEENLAITEFTLDDEDMALLDSLDQGEAGRMGPHPTTTLAEREEMIRALMEQLLARQSKSA